MPDAIRPNGDYKLKEGDKINFAADKINGAFTLMQVEQIK